MHQGLICFIAQRNKLHYKRTRRWSLAFAHCKPPFFFSSNNVCAAFRVKRGSPYTGRVFVFASKPAATSCLSTFPRHLPSTSAVKFQSGSPDSARLLTKDGNQGVASQLRSSPKPSPAREASEPRDDSSAAWATVHASRQCPVVEEPPGLEI